MAQRAEIHQRRDRVYGNNKTYFFGADNLALLAILNSPLMWWYGWRHFIHMKDEALSNDQVKIAELPIAKSLLENDSLKKAVGDLMGAVNRVSVADGSIQEWLHQEFGIKRGLANLRSASALSFDDFIKAIKAGLERGRKLTASEINELPAIESRAEIAAIEGIISNIVNAAYSLSTEEIALLWNSTPPRMPFSPLGSATDIAPDHLAEDDE